MSEPPPKVAPVCSLWSFDQKCSDKLLSRKAISAEDRRLIKLRTNGFKLKDSICTFHFKRYIESFVSHEKYCCNILKKHPDETRVKATSDPLTLPLREKGKRLGLSIIPGKKLCMKCRIELFKLLRTGDDVTAPVISSSSSTSVAVSQDSVGPGCNAGEGTTTSDDNNAAAGSQGSFVAPITKDTLEDINKFLLQQKENPIDLKKLSQKRYVLEQLDILYKIFFSLAKQPVPTTSITLAMENSVYFEEIISQLKEYVNGTCSLADKMHALSILPRSMTIEKIREYFEVSRRLVKNTKSLVGTSGVLCNPNKKQGRPIQEEIVSAAIKFYLRQDISRELPGKNNFVTVRENGERVRKQKHLLMGNISEVHEEFQKLHPEIKISRSKFAAIRPKECCLASNAGMHNVCVCSIHENPKLMFNGAHLNQISDLNSKSPTDCIKFFVCTKPTTECYFRTCSKCPDKMKFVKLIQEYFDSEMVEEVTYNQWESTDRGNIITRISSIEDFIEDFVNLMEDLITHHYIYKEQSAFFNERLNDLQDGEVVIVGDFAENYTFLVNDSIQAMYFKQKQATLHPFSVSYWDSQLEEKQHLSYAVISDHMEHSTVAFYSFQKKLLEDLKKKKVNMKIIYYFSDGCSGQYKNKKMAANVWYHKKDFGIPAQWHFFATSHGKSACDGIGGTLKRLATYYSKQHIQPGTLITTPLLFFEFAQKQIKGICSLWVSTEEVAEVETKLKVRFNSAYKIDGIKSCHSITPCENENFVLIRKYSKALESTKRKISTAEDHTLKLEEVRGYAIYWNHEEPKWNLCYVNSTNEETGEINIEELTNRKGKKYEYEFVEGAAKDILCDDILLLVNPQIMSRGKVIKVLASDSNTADVLLQQALNSQ
ncbi:ARL14 effector protein [Frankliniella fusca]|uniref:ARL14 effector protein n=1 Tax=Frankliniella fusca TaxID=407009 RepID=A0AAE1H0V1_9NEOP|nr:ARL14 effector protein [Frankliniella fusca]